MKNNKFEELKKLLKNAYCPYSKYQVAAIIVMQDGTEYPGVNVENAAYSPGTCAERNAIFGAIARGNKSGTVKEVHILSKKIGSNVTDNIFPAPCGPCRQVIHESSDGNANIFMYNTKGEAKKITIDKLLPLAFKKEHMDI